MSFLTHTHSLSLCFQIDLDTSHPNMKLTTLALCALSLASLGLCSTQAVSTTTLLTSVSCINHKICADPPTRRNSYTFSYTSTPWTTPKATPSTGSNGYGYPIATHTICATDNMSCSTSVDCGNVNSTAGYVEEVGGLCDSAEYHYYYQGAVDAFLGPGANALLFLHPTVF
ncbi:hypothetical protein PTMSG1_07199 [Pyrenophora teres f. maculata]|nr:hypothetical protein PTMSG1_07199 [Pyrenophora teres f. maculata]